MLKPRLLVIAGPNGSGKTTFTLQVLRHDWSAGCTFINPDEIAKAEFGDWNSPTAVMQAAQRAQEMRESCLCEGKSMLLETVFSVPEKLAFVQRAKEADFFVRFFFIGTDGPQINAARVARRVLAGGHDVPITKIISRYDRSMALAAMAMTFVDRAYVYDNSIDDHDPQKLFRTKDGVVFKEYEGLHKHDWALTVRDLLISEGSL